jgi:alpha-L-fucosidase
MPDGISHNAPVTPENGSHRLVNVRTGWCVDVSGASTVDGAKVVQWPGTGGANEDWRIVDL